MNADQYSKWSKPLREHPKAAKALVRANQLITYLCYIIYPLLIAYLFATGNPFAWRAFLFPMAGFAVTTVLRKIINRPRPYEALGIQQIINKDKPGESFPSRHTYSVFAIAMTFLAWCAPLGAIMLIFAVIMGTTRILGGVHYPTDVFAGFALGVLFGSLELLF